MKNKAGNTVMEKITAEKCNTPKFKNMGCTWVPGKGQGDTSGHCKAVSTGRPKKK